jgi:probable F420-dependent oxidoreductase
MDFGLVLQPDPPPSRLVRLAQQAEDYGFSHLWMFDSHLLWMEPYVIFSQILANTRRITVGPFVTNPSTRDWTVTASLFATLNEMYGNRTICGLGRGDSAVRVLGGKPATVKDMREAAHIVRELANCRPVTVGDQRLQLPWARSSRLEIWIAAYGPLALRAAGELGDGYILQLADVDIARWMIGYVREAASAAGRDPTTISFCVAAPAYVTDGSAAQLAHARDQCRWFGGMVGNHVADIVGRYGAKSAVPDALTDYVAGRKGYDYNQHGRAGGEHTQFVPDEVIERFCLLGGIGDQVRKLRALRDIGVDQFALYLQHDAKEHTLEAYGNAVMPAVNPPPPTRLG